MVRLSVYIIFVVFLVNTSLVSSNKEVKADEEVKVDEERSESVLASIRKKTKNKHRSTSSDSDAGQGDSKSTDVESLEMSDSASTSTSKEKKTKYAPPSSKERPGWRKWHRKCKTCPEDMRKKWRDPSIKWICGVYQRARRTFKSACMMQYRNCQDGTMFVKLHEHRCRNESSREQFRHGDHFFYEYKVKMSEDSSDSKATTSEETSVSSSSSF